MTGTNPAGTGRPRGRKVLTFILGTIFVVGASLAIRYYSGSAPAQADPGVQMPRLMPPARAGARSGVQQTGYTAPADAEAQRSAGGRESVPLGSVPARPGSKRAASDPQLKIVAQVNGEPITREQLAQECLKHYGKEVLERLVNKYLVMEECRRRNVTVSEKDVNEEIERMAAKFALPVQEWLKMLKQERGIGPKQYASDIIWPTLALRKLAGQQMEVTQEDLAQQYESLYGEAVKVRMIVCQDAKSAAEVRARAVANPAGFGELAKSQSKDTASAAANGQIQPIRRHVGRKEIEDVVFAMKPGEISPVIRVGNLHAIFKCEGRIPAANVPVEKVKQGLITMIQDSKMRRVADEIFKNLRQQAQVQYVYGDPELSRQMPGVAAIIGGQQMPVRELAEVCLERHGEEVLDGVINRRLLEQACKRNNVKVSAKDLDAEIVRAAGVFLPPKADGTPDVEQFVRRITEDQGVSIDVYRGDSVWPSVALKKLVGDHVEISQDDMRKGFEANYGERVRCRAIVLNNLRHAQQVWELARKTPTEENFGALAEKFSIEASSRSLKGEVPPIQRHGGRPMLEKEAFAMKTGELSSIIQAGPEQYVILFCTGRTKPVDVKYEEVKQYLYEDIHEKKLRLAMADRFQELQDNATIDNFVAGTTRSPKKSAPPGAPLSAAAPRAPGLVK